MQAFGYSIFLVHVSSIERMRFIESVVKKKKKDCRSFRIFFSSSVLKITQLIKNNKRVKFQRICGAASDEEYNRVIKYYQLS